MHGTGTRLRSLPSLYGVTIPPEPFGPVFITAREIYEAVVRTGQKVDSLSDKVISVAEDVLDHDKRLRALEQRRWPIPATSLAVSAMSLVVAVIAILHGVA